MQYAEKPAVDQPLIFKEKGSAVTKTPLLVVDFNPVQSVGATGTSGMVPGGYVIV